MRLLLALLLPAVLSAQTLSDSAATAFGCVWRPQGVPAQDSIALDSAGVRVVIKRTSPGADSGAVRWCPSGTVVLAFRADTVWLDDLRPFVRRDAGSLVVRDTANTNFAFADWRAAVAAMAPLFLEDCVAPPAGFAVVATTNGVTTTRTEVTRVVRGSTCVGVITLGSASRYRAHRWCAGAWLTSPTLSTSRAAALAAVLIPCPTP